MNAEIKKCPSCENSLPSSSSICNTCGFDGPFVDSFYSGDSYNCWSSQRVEKTISEPSAISVEPSAIGNVIEKPNKGQKMAVLKLISSLVILLLLLAVIIVVLLRSKQSSSKDNDSYELNTPGQLVMVTNAEFAPYEYKDGNKIIGIDVEIAQAIADKLGLELVIEDIAFDSIIPGVKSGDYDIGMAGLIVTEARKQSVCFTDTYVTNIQVVIVLEGSSITSIDDLYSGKYQVGVQQGTTGDIYMSNIPYNGGFGLDKVTRYKSGNEAVLDLLKGGCDAVVIDSVLAKALVAANPGLKIFDIPFLEENYAICVKYGNEELRDEINQAIRELREDGTIQRIVDKYIHS